METRVLNDLAIYGGLSFLKEVIDFPENPRPGQFVLKDQNLYGYLKVAGMEAWYPFGQRTVYHVHTQAVPSLIWTVEHNLGTFDVFIQVKDENGNVLSVAKVDVDQNSFTLHFTSATRGTVLVVATATINVAKIRAENLNIADVVIADSTGLRVNGEHVLTNTFIDGRIAQAVQGEATQRASADAALQQAVDLKANAADVYTRAQLYTREEVDAAIQAAISAYHAQRYV